MLLLLRAAQPQHKVRGQFGSIPRELRILQICLPKYFCIDDAGMDGGDEQARMLVRQIFDQLCLRDLGSHVPSKSRADEGWQNGTSGIDSQKSSVRIRCRDESMGCYVDRLDVGLQWSTITKLKKRIEGQSYFIASPKLVQGYVENGVGCGDVPGVQDEDIPSSYFFRDALDGGLICDRNSEDTRLCVVRCNFYLCCGFVKCRFCPADKSNVCRACLRKSYGSCAADTASLPTSITIIHAFTYLREFTHCTSDHDCLSLLVEFWIRRADG